MDNNMYIALIADKMHITFAVLFIFGVRTDALKCYQCDSLSHPKDCEHLMECKQNEACYVEGNVTDSLELRYTSGCLSNNTCNAIIHTDIGQHLIGKRDTRFCRICCDKDFCNTELCDRTDVTVSSGPRCMDCKSIEDPRKCLQETQCRKEETCFTIESSLSPTPKYDMGCAPKRDCMIGYSSQIHSIVGRATNTACSNCCLGNHCNMHLCTGESVVQSYYLHTSNAANNSCADLNQEMCNYIINIQGLSCTDVNVVRMCKKTCNKCKTDSCVDTTEFDCSMAARHFNICEDLESSKRSCPFFCNFCTPVDGAWASWLSWEQCISNECNNGEGKQRRTRRCVNPTPSHGGVPCPGKEDDFRNCTIPINGTWTSWSQWGSCIGSCGYGNMIRTRSCTNPSPMHGGSDCAGTTYDTKSCVYSGCPVNGGWTNWSPWSHCSVTCAVGSTARTRSCSNPAPLNNGTSCSGSTRQTKRCYLINCPGMRLVGGSLGSGRLEIYYNGSWGTVCDDSWDNNEANVVCRMLGYRNGTAKTNAFFGAGDGKIWLDNVACLGDEMSILSCSHPAWGKHDCQHTEDAGVICTN